ncbi:5-formyltetrahydrofolate cyclo-ligase [Listeria riparia]|uniref:5-formyltetrahydrofolate cyclo-ligase n=1 Tax=Listeria riparia FSL S10-1204 TaxID=1265816 RepID=W7DM13_9LIST|nr:5-formyltetrahydrofolate cyclo-ligase [Listeria riparia]EUJ46348.1 5-formyltetrahydrofolate cyclo-ligase [Listeria riparia FSL S10-1204]
MEEKAILRHDTLAKLNEMDEITYENRSASLAKQLYNEEVWHQATTIGITIARFPEVATKEIIRRAWLEGKIVAIPETNNKTRAMHFRRYQPNDPLIQKALGLYEPTKDAPIISEEEIDLLIVPGVVFRSDGYRIGFGGGFYDRYLAGYKGNTISLCYTDQMTTNFTLENHDLPVQKLLIEANQK